MTQVFISYSRKDLSFVEHLAKDLKAAGLDVWYDFSSLEGGTRWGREIQNAIHLCQIFVVVLSPNSVESEWVEKEFMYANSLKRKIVPLLHQPCEMPMWFINLHFIDVQGENYDLHYWAILKAMGVKPGDQGKEGEPATETHSVQETSERQTLPSHSVQPEEQHSATPRRRLKIFPTLIIALMGLAGVLAFAFWGLPPLAAHLATTSTPTATTTHTLTSTFTAIATQTPSSTPTMTLEPSPTFTVTIDPTTGTVSGLIRWNNQPFEGVVVKLCTNWLYTCSGNIFTGVTDADGFFTVAGVSPGDYQVITKYPGERDEIRVQSKQLGRIGSPLVVKVLAGQMANLDRVDICKTDLVLFAPNIKGHFVTFSWQAYPGVTSYSRDITGQQGWDTTKTNFNCTLQPGSYQLMVHALGPACSDGFLNFTMP